MFKEAGYRNAEALRTNEKSYKWIKQRILLKLERKYWWNCIKFGRNLIKNLSLKKINLKKLLIYWHIRIRVLKNWKLWVVRRRF